MSKELCCLDRAPRIKLGVQAVDTVGMISGLFASDGQGAPIWATVLVARLIGGFIGGFIGGAVAVAFIGSRTALGMTSANSIWLLAVPMLISALATGVVITALLPRFSSKHIGLGQATVAAAAGSLFSLCISLVAARQELNTVSGTAGTATLVMFGGGALVFAALSWIGSLVVTTWMVSGAMTDLERWRGETVPNAGNQSWSAIEAINPQDRQIEDDQAERGYWGGMEDASDPDEPPAAG